MSRREKPIVSVTGGTPRGGQLPTGVVRGIDRGLALQRPVVLAHLRSIARRHPEHPPARVVQSLERRYLGAVTASGAAIGATAVVPGFGTGTVLALAGVETIAFLEATALYAQSISEVHGIAVSDPDRARVLVMTMMLGREGSDLVRDWASQATGGAARSAYWGELVTSSLPRMLVGPLGDRLRSSFLKRFAVKGGTGVVAKALPFGVGAALGGAGNHVLARRVVHSSRLAFGAPPELLPDALLPPLPDGSVPEDLREVSDRPSRRPGRAR